MALLCNCNTKIFFINPSFPSNPLLSQPNRIRFAVLSSTRISTSISLCSLKSSIEPSEDDNDIDTEKRSSQRISEQSSWEAKDSEGKDYLYRLGQEADNMNISVGARKGIIDDLFTGNFLGKDSDIVFDYRQKVTRSFEYLQGDYYIAPVFMDKIGKFYESLER